jgi:peroxiredoxin Q/BCP
MLEINQTAPDFTTTNQDDEAVSLSQFKGKQHVVLYFYPKDDTPGCTVEANEFTALVSEFSAVDAVVLGVSKDSGEKHRKFIAKRDLKIELLADTSGEVCEKYGTWGERQFMGKKYMGIARSTFVIDKSGVLVEVNYKVKAKGHAQKMLDFIRTLD